MISICGEVGVFIRVFQGMIHKCFEMDIFPMFHRMQRNPILDFRAIALLAEDDWDATSIEWFPFDSEQSRFVFILPVLGVTRKLAGGMEVNNGGHD